MATQTYTLDIDVNAKSITDLEDQLEQVNAELKEMDRNSEAFAQASKDARALTKELEKSEKAIQGFTAEDKFMAADGAIKIFGGSLATVVGTLGTFGVESEVFGEFEEKAASAIALGIGLKDVSEGIGQASQALKAAGGATKVFGAAVRFATGPVGIIITALGLFATAVVTLKDKFEAFNKIYNFFAGAIKKVGKMLGLTASDAEIAQQKIFEANEASVQALQRELAVAQAAGEEAQKLYDIKKRLLDAELQVLRDSQAEKEEIYAKETEILALNAAEQKRIRESQVEEVEREKVAVVTSIKAKGLATVQVAEQNVAVLEPLKVTEQIITAQQIEAREKYTQAVLENQQKLDMARQTSFDNFIALTGAESKAGRAALIAKQILAAKELIGEAKKTITFATLKGAESTAATATGAAKTAAVGFPQNIPLLIAYAAQAAGIISTVVSAVKGAKQAAGAAGGGGGPSVPVQGPRGAVVPAIPSGQPADTPQDLSVQPTIRAYVLSGDVRSGQEADAKLNTRRTVG